MRGLGEDQGLRSEYRRAMGVGERVGIEAWEGLTGNPQRPLDKAQGH